jgi:4-amino-4-deoxy-L-arabinose transferase-like glycosyltransferase
MNNPPLQMYVAATAGAVGGEALGWLRAAHIALWVTPMLALTGLLARRLFGPAAAVFATLALFTQDELLREAAVVKLDVPLAAVAIGFLGLVVRAAEGESRRRSWALFALALLAALVRYQGAFLGLTGFAVLAIASRRRGAGWRESIAGAAAWSLAGAVVGTVGWFAFAWSCGGHPVETLALNFARLGARSDEPWFQRPLLDYWGSLSRWVGPLVLGMVAGVLALHRRALATDARVFPLLAWVAVNFAFCSVIGLKAERYFVPAMPALCVLAGMIVSPESFERLREAGASERFGRLLRALLLPIAALAAVASLLVVLLTLPERGVNRYYRDVGRSVAALVEPGDRVMLPHVQVAWFARRNYYVTVFEPDAAVLLERLTTPAHRVTAFVTDDRIQTLHPGISPGDRARIEAYLAARFVRVPGPAHANVLVRRSW